MNQPRGNSGGSNFKKRAAKLQVKASAEAKVP